MPFHEPGKVSARASKIDSTIYGKIASTYEAFPLDLTPFTRMRNTIAQDIARNTTKIQFGVPMPSFMLSLARRTSFLK